MKLNREVLVSLREAKGLTQEDVASKSKLDVRTIQRAEAGQPIGAETLAQIAATLGVPNDDLRSGNDQEGAQPSNPEVCVLHALRSPLELLAALKSHQEADIECVTETTSKGRGEAVLALLDAIEPAIPTLTPDVNEPVPSGLEQLRRKIGLEQKLNVIFQRMKESGIQLFAGTFTDMQRIPHYDFDEGFWSTSLRSQPQPVAILVMRIANVDQQRLVVTKTRSEQ